MHRGAPSIQTDTAPSKRSRWFSPGATLRSQLQRIPRPARSGNAAMLLTLPIESRHATPAPLIALRHLQNTHEPQRVRRLDVNSTGARGGRPDEESGDLLPPAHLERVQGSLQWHQYCSCQVRAQRGCAPSCYLKNLFHPHGNACGKEQCCRADLARHMQLCLPERHSGLLYVARITFRRVVECGSANCA